MNVKSTRQSTDKRCWRLRYITDLGEGKLRDQSLHQPSGVGIQL